jgi:hypothetical protein
MVSVTERKPARRWCRGSLTPTKKLAPTMKTMTE